MVVLAAGQQTEGQKEREGKEDKWLNPGQKKDRFPLLPGSGPKKEEWVGSLGTNAGVSGFGGLQRLLTCTSVPSPGSGHILGFLHFFADRMDKLMHV